MICEEQEVSDEENTACETGDFRQKGEVFVHLQGGMPEIGSVQSGDDVQDETIRHVFPVDLPHHGPLERVDIVSASRLPPKRNEYPAFQGLNPCTYCSHKMQIAFLETSFSQDHSCEEDGRWTSNEIVTSRSVTAYRSPLP